MNLMILLFTSLLAGLQLYGIRQLGLAKDFLTSGIFRVGEEEMHASSVVAYTRVYLIFLFLVHLVVWLLGFVHIHPILGAFGCALAFCDFVLNHEVITHLANEPFSSKAADRLMAFGLMLAILQVACCFLMMGLVIIREVG
ncbi:MAG: hypothetical protein H3C47_07820 [Candidatus Cloacimonetes bacterium]|nr:hypothetical protein [Candidatus Cloacimonadota bacterium]